VDPLFAPDDHVVPPPVHTPPAQLPFPFIRSADAVEEIIGAGSDKIAIAKAIEAIAASIDFMINQFPSLLSALTSSGPRDDSTISAELRAADGTRAGTPTPFARESFMHLQPEM